MLRRNINEQVQHDVLPMERNMDMASNEKSRGFFRAALDRLIEARTRQARAAVQSHLDFLNEDASAFLDGSRRKNK